MEKELRGYDTNFSKGEARGGLKGKEIVYAL